MRNSSGRENAGEAHEVLHGGNHQACDHGAIAATRDYERERSRRRLEQPRLPRSQPFELILRDRIVAARGWLPQSELSTSMSRRTPQDAERALRRDSAPQIRLRCASPRMAFAIAESANNGSSQSQGWHTARTSPSGIPDNPEHVLLNDQATVRLIDDDLLKMAWPPGLGFCPKVDHDAHGATACRGSSRDPEPRAPRPDPFPNSPSSNTSRIFVVRNVGGRGCRGARASGSKAKVPTRGNGSAGI
jgi:hypothetical protein